MKITEKDVLKAGGYLYPRKIPKKVIDRWVAEIKQNQQAAKITDYDLLRRPMDF